MSKMDKKTKMKLKKYKGSKVHKDSSDIAPQRYNCTQCHVPQANVKPLVDNKFKPDYRDQMKSVSQIYLIH